MGVDLVEQLLGQVVGQQQAPELKQRRGIGHRLARQVNANEIAQRLAVVQRIPDPDDKRGYLIRLTARGRELVDTIIVGSAQAGSDFLKPLFAVPGAREVLVEMLRFYEMRLEQALS